jgi:hypothetical protein
MTLVYVVDNHHNPLMPTNPAKARILLKQNKAKVLCKVPFTIKLLYTTSTYTQPLTHGVDTGSGIIGSAVATTSGNILYLSEIEVRNDIADKLTQRAKYRRNRRNRKTRYRKPRWLNRHNSIKINRFSPTMTSKINAHLKELHFVESLLPITHTILETATFDPHALKNPAVLTNKLLYQQGINYGFANIKAYVLTRDNYTCQHCKGKSKDRRLEVHHIQFRTNNGSNEPENLITLCKTCHDKVHHANLKLKLDGKKQGQLKHATQMNSIRIQLLKQLPAAEETFGFITKEHRQLYTDQKEHYLDAAFIATQGTKPIYQTNQLLQKKCISDGDYQQTKGIRSEQSIQTDKIQGFRKFDKVSYQGQTYFIKGRMSTGYAILMDITGQKIPLKPIPKFSKMTRESARKSWIIQPKPMANIFLLRSTSKNKVNRGLQPLP